MRLVAYLTALALLLAPCAARADDPTEVDLHYISPGKEMTCLGSVYRCYDFGAWKTLLLTDADLWTTKQELELIRTSLDLRIEELGIQQQINLNLTTAHEELTIEVSRLRTVNDKLLKENAKLSMPKPGPWIVFVAGLVLLATGGGMLIGSAQR